jgi:hypothetical protein
LLVSLAGHYSFPDRTVSTTLVLIRPAADVGKCVVLDRTMGSRNLPLLLAGTSISSAAEIRQCEEVEVPSAVGVPPAEA